MKKVIASAPGKLMLLGEHAVVYNRPCIVTAIDQRIHVCVELIEEKEFQMDAIDVKITGYKKPLNKIGIGDIPKGAKFIEIAVKNLIEQSFFLQNAPSVKKGWRNLKGLRITTRSEFSSQFGFGSSSAATVCAVKVLAELFKLKLSQREIFDLAYKTVLDIQGKGSGFDTAAAVYGGTLYFMTGGKIIEPLKINNFPLIVGYSGVKADTTSLIDHVKEKADKYPKVIDGVYDEIAILVKHAKKAILINDWQTLGEVMNFNQGYLAAIGVSSNKLSNMIYAARNAGAFGAKLSGAGGGDCMIAIAPENKNKSVESSIIKAGGEIIKVKANAEGVKIEK